mmetsp:Transcript_17309/g.45167  ORF Transcript_17309/g.45167 Transcript_17309/m.45167 type:complete len:210 (+) Transcript_17309:1155-1784(+)
MTTKSLLDLCRRVDLDQLLFLFGKGEVWGRNTFHLKQRFGRWRVVVRFRYSLLVSVIFAARLSWWSFPFVTSPRRLNLGGSLRLAHRARCGLRRSLCSSSGTRSSGSTTVVSRFVIHSLHARSSFFNPCFEIALLARSLFIDSVANMLGRHGDALNLIVTVLLPRLLTCDVPFLMLLTLSLTLARFRRLGHISRGHDCLCLFLTRVPAS